MTIQSSSHVDLIMSLLPVPLPLPAAGHGGPLPGPGAGLVSQGPADAEDLLVRLDPANCLGNKPTLQ